MATLNVDQINDSAGTGAPDFPNGLKIGTTSALTDYETVDVAMGGDFTGGDTIRLTRFGGQVYMTGTTTATHASSSVRTSSAGIVPAAFRPTEATRNVYFANDGGGLKVAQVTVTTAGTVQVVYMDASFSLLATTSTGSPITSLWAV